MNHEIIRPNKVNQQITTIRDIKDTIDFLKPNFTIADAMFPQKLYTTAHREGRDLDREYAQKVAKMLITAAQYGFPDITGYTRRLEVNEQVNPYSAQEMHKIGIKIIDITLPLAYKKQEILTELGHGDPHAATISEQRLVYGSFPEYRQPYDLQSLHFLGNGHIRFERLEKNLPILEPNIPYLEKNQKTTHG